MAGTLILRFGAWAAMQSGLPRILHPLPMTLLPLALLMTTPIMLHNLLTPTVLYQLCIIGFIPFYQRLSRTRTFEMVFWRVTLAQFLAILMMFGWTVLWFGR